MKLEWNNEGTTVWAASGWHDEGSPFHYEFNERPDGTWLNVSDGELRPAGSPDTFNTLDDAKAWAEAAEREAANDG